MGNAKKEDAAKDKKTINSLRNEQQKAKSRVAAQTRRKNENENINLLTRIVPWIPENPPDKSTIIRLSTSYIGLKKVLNGSTKGRMIGNGCTATKGVENFSLEALDGFVIILARDGLITFVNEKVLSYLGIPPHELMGKKIYNYVLKKDWDFLAKKLRGPLPSLDNPNLKEPQNDPDDVICEPEATELFVSHFENAAWKEKIQFSVRMQCNSMTRTATSKSTNFQIVRFTGRINGEGYFMGTGEWAWSPNVGDLPVFEPAFISRLSPDLKLVFCEGRIHRYMDSKAKDIVGRAAYPFYHPTDVFQIQKLHSKLLAEGKVTTVPYRWMNKDGGWVWLKSTTTRIQDEKTGKTYMLCVNYVLSAIENKGVVVGVDPEQKGRVVEKKSEKENENDSDDAYLVDELTEAFTRSKPFGQPTYPNGQRQESTFNVFDSNYKQKYTPSFTTQEMQAKPLQEFYAQEKHQQNNTPVREQSETRFEYFPWPQRDEQQQVEENRLPQRNSFNGLYNTQQLEELSLQDLVAHGQFATNCFQPLHWENPGRICELQQAEAPGLEESYMKEQYNIGSLGHAFAPAEQMMADPDDLILPDEACEVISELEMPELFLPDVEELNQENQAYNASLYLFMNEIPVANETQRHMEKPRSEYSSPNYQMCNNAGVQGMLPNGQEQCYKFSQMNNNNILPNNIRDAGEISNGYSEDACILEFDQTMLESNY